MIEFIKKPIKAIAKFIRRSSIQLIITVSFTFVTIVAMLFVGIALFNTFSMYSHENAIINTNQIADEINVNMGYYLKNMIYISSLIESNIKKDENLPNSQVLNQMEIVSNTRDDIVALAVFTDKGDVAVKLHDFEIKGRANVENQVWFKEAINNPNKVNISLPHVENIFYGNHSWVVSLSKCVKYKRAGKEVTGVLLVDMNFRSLDQLCQQTKLGNMGYIYIIDAKGNIVYHPQQQLIYMGLKQENIKNVLSRTAGNFIETFDNKQRLVTVKNVKITGWKIVGIYYLDQVVATKKNLKAYSVLIILLGILFVTAISKSLSAKISRPIKELEKCMKLVEEGRFDVKINVEGEYEVVRLSKAFNMMVSRITNLMEQIVREQEGKRKSELDALQAQINPHFLYNTLDSVVWMIENEKNQEAVTMITALARLFRISISRGKNIITVREELEHAKNYLIIQKIRYRNKFEFKIEVQDDVFNYSTIKLILQPIIENSIYHGIECSVDQGEILIYAGIEENKLLLMVKDNGLGMREDVVKNILVDENRKSKGSGVGIKNVDQRIKLCYGQEYGLKIDSELEVGTEVKIYLPLYKDSLKEVNTK
ncbi:sensor histidine kinase [Clostridiaceae bacterium UIB06]|uniref:Sensor histidine kinase n=1 Tax=Clostridium thailandense TaxID=2794346 RepID=A0A949TTS0_9CLOT|nr:sensor histidine kinase [Clostridium thailandense]MBV7273251.1 sensor histidine kinase [Clostridium thailandense]MCH5137952.1 sensor histidine kinase [Clostridiaceae bacterium UIB06]